jgi:hypothetical protein
MVNYTAPTMADIRAKHDELKHNSVVKRPLIHARIEIASNQWQSYVGNGQSFNTPFANLKG